MSSFVAKIVDEALKEKLETLKKGYIEAEYDLERQKDLQDWDILDTEGWE